MKNESSLNVTCINGCIKHYMKLACTDIWACAHSISELQKNLGQRKRSEATHLDLTAVWPHICKKKIKMLCRSWRIIKHPDAHSVLISSGKLDHSHAICYKGTFLQSSRLGPASHCMSKGQLLCHCQLYPHLNLWSQGEKLPIISRY